MPESDLTVTRMRPLGCTCSGVQIEHPQGISQPRPVTKHAEETQEHQQQESHFDGEVKIHGGRKDPPEQRPIPAQALSHGGCPFTAPRSARRAPALATTT